MVYDQSILPLVTNLVVLITFTLDDLLMLLGENWCWSLLRPKGLKAVHTWSVRTWPTFTNWRFNFIHHHTLVISSRVMIFLLSSSNLYISAANLVTGLKVTKVKEGKRELNYWKQNSNPSSNIHAVGQNEIQVQMVSLLHFCTKYIDSQIKCIFFCSISLVATVIPRRNQKPPVNGYAKFCGQGNQDALRSMWKWSIGNNRQKKYFLAYFVPKICLWLQTICSGCHLE